MSLLLVGCGSAANSDGGKDTEASTTHRHDYGTRVITEATCETEGVREFVCDCGDTYTEVIEALGHKYENYVSNNDATYLADGTETAVCVCGSSDTRTAEGSKLEYTFADMNEKKYAKETVNVRDLPSIDGNRIGSLSFAQQVVVTGQCIETKWYRIEYNGGVGYVSNAYIADKDPTPPTQSGSTNTTPQTPPPTPETNPPSGITSSMSNALFIGDSRTVGIQLYSGMNEPDYFAAVSTSVNAVINKNVAIDVSGVGSVTLPQLLDQKTYDKVYIMLGINEAGMGASTIASNTKKLIDLIQSKQPGAVIFIMANLYVSDGYQSSRPSFSTENMQAINSAQGALANNSNIFYMDANFMFVDANGDLSTEYSNDGCHLKSAEYKRWVQWIKEQTNKLLGL